MHTAYLFLNKCPKHTTVAYHRNKDISKAPDVAVRVHVSALWEVRVGNWVASESLTAESFGRSKN